MSEYEEIRRQYRPEKVKALLIAESPPPDDFMGGSRHFYRREPRSDDRLFSNTIRALYPEAAELDEKVLQQDKEKWLLQFRADGFYMIESVEKSIPHAVKKTERQRLIREGLNRLIERVGELADENTGIILIKSNVFDVAAKPLQDAGFKVLNEGLVDYPGHYNQTAYRQKLASLIEANH